MRSDLLAIINTDNLRHNVRALRGCCRPGTPICAAVKADAYGHGVRVCGPALHEAGVEHAAVATLIEAVELRETGWMRPILVLGNVLAVGDAAERADRIRAIPQHGLTLTVVDDLVVRHVTAAAPPKPIDVHVKVDTGMGRMGELPDAVAGLIDAVVASPHLRLTGIYSHFATADFEQQDLANAQIACFKDVLSRVSDRLPRGVIRHLANSAATITRPDTHFDMVRPGLAVYGYPPAAHMASRIDLRPALRLVSHFTAIKTLPAGHCVGYGTTFTTQRSTRLGIVPAGYFDGIIRANSNNGVVTTPAGDAPIIGRVSMDQLAVDLTDLPLLPVGSETTLISDQRGRPNSMESIAERLGTIPYEVMCLLGRRIQRIAASNGSPG